MIFKNHVLAETMLIGQGKFIWGFCAALMFMVVEFALIICQCGVIMWVF